MNIDPQLSVIIPFAGKRDDLVRCLDSLYANHHNLKFEVIVVQSGNKESLAESLRRYETLTILHYTELFYPGKARNIGVQHAKSKYFAFIDADCETCHNWADIAFSSISEGGGIIIGPVVNENYFKPIASVDNLLQFVDFQKDRSLKNISHFPGTNFVIKRSIFEKVRGFQNDLQAGEDVIFSQAVIKLTGEKIYFNKELIVKHRGRNSLTEFIEHQRSFGFYRGMYNLKSKSPVILKNNYMLRAVYAGLKRLFYIYLKTMQWNLKATPMLIIYSPLIFLGLFSWSIGFYSGIRKTK